MDRKKILKTTGRVATVLLVVATLSVVVYIMANRLGLVDSLDFGAGAYYYADIPEFDRLEKQITYDSPVGIGLCTVLFLAWGFLMFKLWKWVDGRPGTGNSHKSKRKQDNENQAG